MSILIFSIIILLSISIIDMVTNPFFSCRIPQELFDKANEHCKETGKTRTELLIYALSTVLNYPVNTKTVNFSPQVPEITREMFESLVQRVQLLEEAVKNSKSSVITNDNSDNKLEDNICTINKQSEEKSDDNVDDNIFIKEIEKSRNGGNNELEESSHTINKHLEEQFSHTNVNDNINDNNSNQSDNVENHIGIQKLFTPLELAEITSAPLRRFSGLKAVALRKLKKENRFLVPNELLDSPVLIELKNPFSLEGQLCNVVFMGENQSGEALFKPVFIDNNNYQTEIIQFALNNND